MEPAHRCFETSSQGGPAARSRARGRCSAASGSAWGVERSQVRPRQPVRSAMLLFLAWMRLAANRIVRASPLFVPTQPGRRRRRAEGVQNPACPQSALTRTVRDHDQQRTAGAEQTLFLQVRATLWSITPTVRNCSQRSASTLATTAPQDRGWLVGGTRDRWAPCVNPVGWSPGFSKRLPGVVVGLWGGRWR